jgi:hypothetical protein
MSYGLTEPFATVNFELIDQTVTLKIGNAYDGGRYCTADDVGIIWKISDISLPWATVTPLSITSSMLVRRSIYNLTELDITSGGVTDKFTVAGTNNEDMTVALNGTPQSNTDNFRLLYQYIAIMPATDLYLEPVTGEPAAEIKLHGDGFNDIFAFYPIENRLYVITINGEPQFVTSAAYVERLADNLEAYKNGGEIKTDW